MSDAACPNCGQVVTEGEGACHGCGLRFSGDDRKVLWLNKGDLLCRMGKPQEAADAYAAAIRLDPDDLPAYEKRARALEAAGKLEAAAACLRRVMELSPENVGGRIELGGLLWKTGKKEEALAIFREALQHDPHSIPALRNLATGLFNIGRFNEAAELFEQMASLVPPEDGLDFLAHSRDAHLNAKDRPGALRLCRRILELDPDNSENLKKMGDLLCERGEVNEALLCFEEALRIQPRDAAAWIHRGDAECLAGRTLKGIVCYDEALDIDDRLPRAWAHKGVALDFLDRSEEAARCLATAMELKPGDDDIQMARAEVLIKLGHFSDALSLLEELVGRSPGLAMGWLRIGDAQQALSRHELALEAYEKALSLDAPEAWLKKAAALFHMDRYPEALAAADKSLSLELRSDFAWYIKGAIYFTLGQFEEAQEAAEQAQAINPSNVDASRLLEACMSRTRVGEQSHSIEDVFIVLNDGRLLAHVSRNPGQTADEVLLSGMFTAIQKFIKDSFRYTSNEELGMLEMGRVKILIEHWRTIFSAVVISGGEPLGLRREMRRMLVHIYDKFHPVLEPWTGERDKTAGIAKEAARLIN